jgi:hypothetical protein
MVRAGKKQWSDNGFGFLDAPHVKDSPSYHFNSGNCLNTLRTPSLQSLLSVLK